MSTASTTHARHRHHSPSRGRGQRPGAGAVAPVRPMLLPAPPAGLFDGLRRVIDSLEQSTLASRPAVRPAERTKDCGCGRDCGCCGGQRDWGCGCNHQDKDCGCGSHHGHRDKDCDCEDSCSEDSCACTCCVSDADLVVYARLGERRVVPLTVVNERRRERTVELDLGEFRTAGGGAVPVTGVVTPTTMKLSPCQEEQALLAINISFSDGVGPIDRDGDDDGSTLATDVDDCVTAYADLRLTGCDTRPIRVAVVLLPRVCNVYRIRCGLGCC